MGNYGFIYLSVMGQYKLPPPIKTKLNMWTYCGQMIFTTMKIKNKQLS